MNILIINPILYTPDSGIIPARKSIKDTMIYGMCLGFIKMGCNVVLAAADEYRPIEKENYDFKVLFFKSTMVSVFPPSVLPYSLEFKKWLRKHCDEFQLVIASEVFSFQSLMASRICPEKTIVWHELALFQKRFLKIPAFLWYNVIARLFMRKLFVVPRSIAAYDFIKRYMPKTTDKYIEHGINIEKFEYTDTKEDYLMYVGQLIKRKNIPEILKNFAEYKKRSGSEIRLKLAGTGPMETELKEMAISLGIKKDVEFLGYLNHRDLNMVLKKSKGLLIDTLQDNNMVSIPEAIVSGTPVLTNSVPTNSFIVKKNNLGIVCDGWSWKELERLIAHNGEYVDNCMKFRWHLSNEYAAKMFLDFYSANIKQCVN